MLIGTLKQHHKGLLQLIRQLDLSLAHGDAAGVRTTLSSLSQALQAHVAMEEQELYPGLSRSAEATHTEWLLETARLFSDNMQRITTLLQGLLSGHGASFDLERFRANWSTLSTVLVRRIESEERTLYPLYERRVLGLPPLLLSERPPGSA